MGQLNRPKYFQALYHYERIRAHEFILFFISIRTNILMYDEYLPIILLSETQTYDSIIALVSTLPHFSDLDQALASKFQFGCYLTFQK